MDDLSKEDLIKDKDGAPVENVRGKNTNEPRKPMVLEIERCQTTSCYTDNIRVTCALCKLVITDVEIDIFHFNELHYHLDCLVVVANNLSIERRRLLAKLNETTIMLLNTRMQLADTLKAWLAIAYSMNFTDNKVATEIDFAKIKDVLTHYQPIIDDIIAKQMLS